MPLFHRSISALCCGLFSVTIAWSARAQVSDSLNITGTVKQPHAYTVSDLRALPVADIFSVTLPTPSEGVLPASSVRGVRISKLVNDAELVLGDKHAWKHLVVIATATDGYRAVFSWPELSNTVVGDQALVIFERDGNPLDAREGALALYSGADKHAGPRNVRWLKSIEVRSLD